MSQYPTEELESSDESSALAVDTSRPVHPGALSVEDLVEHTRVTVHNRDGSLTHRYIVMGPADSPLDDRPQLCVIDGAERFTEEQVAAHDCPGDAQWRSLADMGVVPYEDGTWNTTNYTTAYTG